MARRRRKWDPNRKGGRGRQSHFMDAAMDGYVRDRALHLWRDYAERVGSTEAAEHRGILEELGGFQLAGPYGDLWRSAWNTHVLGDTASEQPHLFSRMETAVREAIVEEQAERKRRGDGTIEDTPGYLEFVGRAMNQLLSEASGEIEEMD